VLKVDGKSWRRSRFADSDKLEVGDVVLAVGNARSASRGRRSRWGSSARMGRGGFGINNYEKFQSRPMRD